MFSHRRYIGGASTNPDPVIFGFSATKKRHCIDATDLFQGHIGGGDILARSLLNAAATIEGGELDTLVSDCYAGWNNDAGKALLASGSNLEAISDAIIAFSVFTGLWQAAEIAPVAVCNQQ